MPRKAPPPPIARGLPCDSQAAIRVQGRPHRRREAGAAVTQVGPHAPDALSHHPDRPLQPAVRTIAPAWRCRTLRGLAVRRGCAISRLARFLSFRYRCTSRWCRMSVCLCSCRSSRSRSAAAGRSPRGRPGPVQLPVRRSASIAELATAGAAAAMPTLITAIRGALNGPPHVVGQWSASLPRVSVRQSVTSLRVGPVPGPLAEQWGRKPRRRRARRRCRSLACIPVRSGRPGLGCGPSSGYRCVPIPRPID